LFIEESLDEVAFAIECKIARSGLVAAWVGRNHRGDVPLGEGVDKRVGVVCHVADQSLWMDRREQWLCASEIVSLSGRKHQLDGIAESIDDRVNFGGQSATRSADRLRTIFFRAPALC